MDAEVRYFEASCLSTGDGSRVARPLVRDRTLVHRLGKSGRVEDVLELTWIWQSAIYPPGDIVFTVNGIRVVSPLVRQIFDNNLTAQDEIQWLRGTVIDNSGERLPYWVPHFPVHHDIIDADHTTFGSSGLPIRYFLSRDELAKHAVTVIPGIPLNFVLSEPVVDALRAANAVGIRVTLAPVY